MLDFNPMDTGPHGRAYPWEIGKNYFIRCATHHFTGTLVDATEKELVLVNCCWIADDGRFHVSLKTGSFNEIEPYPKNKKVIINRNFVVDACTVDFPLPEEAK